MVKEFRVNDILDAVNSIYKIEKKKSKTIKKKDTERKDRILSLNKQAKSHNSNILVLEKMIK